MVNVSFYNQNTATIFRKQTPTQTNWNTMIQKIQSCIDKKQKISGKHQRKKQKKILKLKKLNQTSTG